MIKIHLISQQESWRVVYTVRRDWRDGTHEYIGPRANEAAAERLARRDLTYWRRGPLRPTNTVGEISLRDYDLHSWRRDCRLPDCPGGRRRQVRGDQSDARPPPRAR